MNAHSGVARLQDRGETQRGVAYGLAALRPMMAGVLQSRDYAFTDDAAR